MTWAVATVVFLGIALFVIAVAYAFSMVNLPIAERLDRLWRPTAQKEELGFKEKQKQRMQRALSGVGKLLPTGKDASRAQRMMLRAGFRRPEALAALRGAKVLCVLGLLSLVYFTGFYLKNPMFVLSVAAIAGYLLPDFWLTQRIHKRQRILRLSLPDALDLLVICVEAGLAIDQGLLRVSQELDITHPELCEELSMVNNETRVGKPRLDALRDLASRTGVDDIKALVAMLVQADRFGTSVAQSLRVHSDQLRIMRRQRAEEQAAKVTVKMVPALVLFIFPAMFAVLLGPAVISIARFFSIGQ